VTLTGHPARDWQGEALTAWRLNHRRGVIEAVTGTGKTRVGILAAHEALERRERVAVIVPTLDLLEQWDSEIAAALPSVRRARCGGGYAASLDDCDVLLTTVQSGMRYQLGSDSHRSLLIADEVHRYGSEGFSAALEPGFASRMGLTATLERSDEGVEATLLPYFGRKVFTCGFERALLSHFRVGFLPVSFRPDERRDYVAAEERAKKARGTLINAYGCDPYHFGTFMAQVSGMAGGPASDERDVARKYLSAFSQRKKLTAESSHKVEALRHLAPFLAQASRTLVFTETKHGAEIAASVLRAGKLRSESLSSDDDRTRRKEVLRRFRTGSLQVLAAPRILDEGIDVPAADVGVIVAATQSRRQMIQRMGRILRKVDGKDVATLVVMYVEGSMEDPNRDTGETFLDDIRDFADDVETVDPIGAQTKFAHWWNGGR
jgi:RNA polymerase primary sigma factor